MDAYYTAAYTKHQHLDSKDADDIRDEIVKEIRVGIETSGVRAGVIGEIGATFPWGSNEEKVLQGAARAQVATGAPIEVHPGRNRGHPAMILDLLEKERVDLSRAVICHIERTLGEFAEFKAILDRGCFVGIDLFGL